VNTISKRVIPFSPPDFGETEIEAVIKTLRSGWITTGPRTKEFENKIAARVGVEKAVCLSSATSAMELVLRILGVGPGDEVITSAYTFTASASVITHVGAKVVLVDTSKDSYEMDYNLLSEAITEKTKVIIPVDFAGVICDYDKIYEIINKKKSKFMPSNDIQKGFGRVIVMADSAHAFGAKRDSFNCGQLADFSCFSFHAVKNLTTAEGGAVVWRHHNHINHEWLYNQFMLYSLHGQSKDALAKNQLGSWEYDIVFPAYKCNMTDIMASLGIAQLKRYDQLIERRHRIISMYNQGFKDLGVTTLSHSGDGFTSSGHLYPIRIDNYSENDRNNVIVRLGEMGVASNVHFKPLPLLTAYKNLGFSIESYPNAYDMYKNEVTLPLHTLLSDEDVMYVIECLRKAILK